MENWTIYIVCVKADSKRVFLVFPHSLLTRPKMYVLPQRQLAACRRLLMRPIKSLVETAYMAIKIFSLRNFY